MTQDNAGKQSDDTGMSDDQSADQNKENQDAGNEDGSQVGDGDKKQSGMVRDITKLREDRRVLRESETKLKDELSEIKELLTKHQSGGNPKSDEEVDAAAMDKRLLALLGERERELNRTSQSSKANEMFKGLKWVQEDAVFGDEVQDTMHREYGDMVDDNPVRALRLAYDDVCKSHDVSPERIDNSASRASGGPKGPSSAGSSPKADEKAYKQLLQSTDMSDPKQRELFKQKLKALEGSG